jgi:hypothetical protein
MDLVVILWKILFHGLGCHPMENLDCSIDLVVVLWKILFHRLPYEKFLFHGLGCRPMEKSFLFVTIDLIVVLWIHICICFLP